MTSWPKKEQREGLEITGFIAAYSRLSRSVRFEVVRKGEKPDYIVRDSETGQEYGVELTSVYLDDRSVPDVHMRDDPGPVRMPDDKAELEAYRTRLVGAILDKVCKARKGYDTSRPLILSVYVNEYISIYMPGSEVQAFINRYDGVFENMAPFSKVVFWNLSNGDVVSAKPSGHNV
jgi:hypothetical protein